MWRRNAIRCHVERRGTASVLDVHRGPHPSFLSFSRRSLTASKRPKFDAMRRGVAPLVSILFDAIEEGGACTVHAPG